MDSTTGVVLTKSHERGTRLVGPAVLLVQVCMGYWIFFLSDTARGDGPKSCVEYVGDRQLEIARAGYHLLPPPLKRALFVLYSGEEKSNLYTVLSFFFLGMGSCALFAHFFFLWTRARFLSW